jgi:gliding motility-associated-like protein
MLNHTEMLSISKLKRTLYALFILAFPQDIQAQSTFQFLYTHPDAPILFISNLLDTGDSIVFARGYRQKSAYIDITKTIPILLAMNREGEVLWAKEFRSTTTNGRILDLGDIYPSSDGNLNVTFSNTFFQNFVLFSGTGVVKISKNGDILNMPNYIDANTFTHPGTATKLMIPNPATGGFILAGTKQNFNNSVGKKHFCAQLDANGQLIPGPNNLRFFNPQYGEFDPLCGFIDEQQHWYASAPGPLSFVKMEHNATGPAWMKQLETTDFYNAILGGVAAGNGSTAWGGNGRDSIGEYGIFMTINAEGTLTSFKKYRSSNLFFPFSQIIKNNAGFLTMSLNDYVIQLDSIGNVLWAKKYLSPSSGKLAYFNKLIPEYYQNGYWIVGAIERQEPSPINGFVGKIDLNGNVASCCNQPYSIEVSDCAYTLTDLPFTIENDSLQNTPWPMTTSEITLSKTSLCAPINYTIPNAAPCTGGCITVLPPALPPGATASWEFPAGASAEFIPGTDSIRICFNNEGPQNLRLNVKFSEECTFPYDNTVTVSNSIKPLVFSLSDTLFCPGICTDIQLNSSSPATITTLGGTAQTGDSLRICYPEAGNYPIIVQQVQEGCLRTHTIEVMVQNLLDETPNAFTPNGDGLNETFRPIIDCIPDVYLLQIFNRWGEMVFQTENYLDAWDGTYKGQPAPVDTYIWTVNSNNVQKAYKGDVTLIR